MTLTKQTFIKFQWEGNENPNDPSGVATFSYEDDKINIEMNYFEHAVLLNSMIENACLDAKDSALMRAQSRINRVVEELLYD